MAATGQPSRLHHAHVVAMKNDVGQVGDLIAYMDLHHSLRFSCDSP